MDWHEVDILSEQQDCCCRALSALVCQLWDRETGHPKGFEHWYERAKNARGSRSHQNHAYFHPQQRLLDVIWEAINTNSLALLTIEQKYGVEFSVNLSAGRLIISYLHSASQQGEDHVQP